MRRLSLFTADLEIYGPVRDRRAADVLRRGGEGGNNSAAGELSRRLVARALSLGSRAPAARVTARVRAVK